MGVVGCVVAGGSIGGGGRAGGAPLAVIRERSSAFGFNCVAAAMAVAEMKAMTVAETKTVLGGGVGVDWLLRCWCKFRVDEQTNKLYTD